jgi:hypothetical protein
MVPTSRTTFRFPKEICYSREARGLTLLTFSSLISSASPSKSRASLTDAVSPSRCLMPRGWPGSRLPLHKRSARLCTLRPPGSSTHGCRSSLSSRRGAPPAPAPYPQHCHDPYCAVNGGQHCPHVGTRQHDCELLATPRAHNVVKPAWITAQDLLRGGQSEKRSETADGRRSTLMRNSLGFITRAASAF